MKGNEIIFRLLLVGLVEYAAMRHFGWLDGSAITAALILVGR